MEVRRQPLRVLRFRAGDAIHNLRAVADNLICALGQTRGASDRLALQFHNTRTAHAVKYMSQIDCLPIEIKEWIVSEQPYSRTNGKSTLNILNMLWNADKHKSPTLVAAAIPSVTLIARKDSLDLEIIRNRGLNDGDKIGTVSVPVGHKMDFNCDFTFDIAFSQKSAAQGAIVKTWLADAHKYITAVVVPKFEPFLPCFFLSWASKLERKIARLDPILQLLPINLPNCQHRPLTIGCLSRVVPKIKLRKIPMQMLLADMMKRAVDSTFQ